jgi:hypothetical protein
MKIIRNTIERILPDGNALEMIKARQSQPGYFAVAADVRRIKYAD